MTQLRLRNMKAPQILFVITHLSQPICHRSFQLDLQLEYRYYYRVLVDSYKHKSMYQVLERCWQCVIVLLFH